MNILSIFINEQIAYEYDKDALLDEQKLAYFDNMDSDMERGIKVKGELITTPNKQQRANFVALNLIKALQQENMAVITASCAYLDNRRPSLTELHAKDHDTGIEITFVDKG